MLICLLAIGYSQTELIGTWAGQNGPLEGGNDYRIYFNTSDEPYPYVDIVLNETGYFVPTPLDDTTVLTAAAVTTLFDSNWSVPFNFSEGYPYLSIVILDSTFVPTTSSIDELQLVSVSISENASQALADLLNSGDVYVLVHKYDSTDGSWFVSAIAMYDNDHLYIDFPSDGVYAFSLVSSNVAIPVVYGYTYAFGTNNIILDWGDVMISGKSNSQDNNITAYRNDTSNFTLDSLDTDYELVSEHFYTFDLDNEDDVQVTMTFDYGNMTNATTDNLALAYYDEGDDSWKVEDDCTTNTENMTLSCNIDHLSTWIVVQSNQTNGGSSGNNGDNGSGVNAIGLGFALLMAAAFAIFN